MRYSFSNTIMKYLGGYLYYAVLCLLLVCSANVASAQVVPSLERVSTTETSVSRTIEFKVSLSRQLMNNESRELRVSLGNVLRSEIMSATLLTSPNLINCRLNRFTANTMGVPQYNLCIGAGERDVTLQLVLNSSFDRRKTITIFLLPGRASEDDIIDVLRYPGVAFTQMLPSLEEVSTTETSVSRTIEFKVSLDRELMSNEFSESRIVLGNVLRSEIMSVSLLTSDDVTNCFSSFNTIVVGMPQYSLCIDAGQQDVTLQLVLNSSFDRRKTITVFLLSLEEQNVIDTLRYPGTVLFVRSKVFLEGPLQ